ncbi:unnamed protein product [Lampetra fluviatilis]
MTANSSGSGLPPRGGRFLPPPDERPARAAGRETRDTLRRRRARALGRPYVRETASARGHAARPGCLSSSAVEAAREGRWITAHTDVVKLNFHLGVEEPTLAALLPLLYRRANLARYGECTFTPMQQLQESPLDVEEEEEGEERTPLRSWRFLCG